ncbi:hypothetical protein KP509_17G041800 [Ceratopteris richardii]|uniref:Uncharacterized protein n=1 Tax=Ceratopteris richardii TaxID=49495 RepID=A0A8T2SXB5_CERRI|nr:hypothetical protein KP509_17G041800 [Ceratopteris richardii]
MWHSSSQTIQSARRNTILELLSKRHILILAAGFFSVFHFLCEYKGGRTLHIYLFPGGSVNFFFQDE